MRLDQETTTALFAAAGSREAVLAEITFIEATLADLALQARRLDSRAGDHMDSAWRSLGYARDIIESK
jgi:hypothetical protein